MYHIYASLPIFAGKTIPIFQNHSLMIHLTPRAANEYSVQFVDGGFRPLFREGQDFAREHGMYMQKYCGCIFSEEDRYMTAKRKKAAKKAAE